MTLQYEKLFGIKIGLGRRRRWLWRLYYLLLYYCYQQFAPHSIQKTRFTTNFETCYNFAASHELYMNFTAPSSESIYTNMWVWACLPVCKFWSRAAIEISECEPTRRGCKRHKNDNEVMCAGVFKKIIMMVIINSRSMRRPWYVRERFFFSIFFWEPWRLERPSAQRKANLLSLFACKMHHTEN